MIGKTIAATQGYCDAMDLWFTDGTMFLSDSMYIDDEYLNGLLTPAQTRRVAAERQGERERERLVQLRDRARRVATARERTVAAAEFDLTTEHGREGFLIWQEWRWPTYPFMQLMKETFMEPIREQLNHQLYGGGKWYTIKKTTDTRTESQKRVDALIKRDVEILDALR